LSRLTIQNPDSPKIMAQTSIAFSRIKNYKQAIAFVKKALLLDPENIDYKYNLAVFYDLDENYELAMASYKNILRIIESSALEEYYDKAEEIKKRIEVMLLTN